MGEESLILFLDDDDMLLENGHIEYDGYENIIDFVKLQFHGTMIEKPINKGRENIKYLHHSVKY